MNTCMKLILQKIETVASPLEMNTENLHKVRQMHQQTHLQHLIGKDS